MSYAVPPVDLSILVVGSPNVTASADWTGKVATGSPSGVKGGRATVRLKNESNFGLFYSLGRHTGHLGAGEWSDLVLDGQNAVTVYAEYQLSGASPNLLLATVFEPGEPVPPSPPLGNSAVQGISSLSTKIPVNTTGGNQVAIELGPDPHSLADWELLVTSAGDLQLFDSKNSRVVWTGRFSDGAVGAKQLLLSPVDTTAGNQILLVTATDAHSGKSWGVFAMQDGSLLFQEETTGNFVLRLSPSNGISEINNQLTAGSFGVPMLVAQALDVAVTVTTAVNILVYAVATSGWYRVSATFIAGNTGSQPITLNTQYTDPDGVATASIFLTGDNSVAQALGGASIAATFTYATAPMLVHAKAGTNITVTYRDGGGTPNDKVTAFIEKMA